MPKSKRRDSRKLVQLLQHRQNNLLKGTITDMASLKEKIQETESNLAQVQLQANQTQQQIQQLQQNMGLLNNDFIALSARLQALKELEEDMSNTKSSEAEAPAEEQAYEAEAPAEEQAQQEGYGGYIAPPKRKR